MFREEKKVDEYGVLQRLFYFEYFPVWAAKEWPNIQLAEDFLVREWIFMFKQLDQYPLITQNFVMDVFKRLLLESRLIKSIIENSTLAIAVIPPSKPKKISSLHRFADFLCKGNHNLKNYRGLIKKTKETSKGTKKFPETFESLEVVANPDIRNILVLDDVSTTGVSLAAASKLLKDAGYKGKIFSLSFARTMKNFSSDKRFNTIQLPDIFSLDPLKDSSIFSKKKYEIANLIKQHYRR
tara:strand:- start:811 stop:1527 length:717 start_codon:yes stop_codon:yes gene_type:complete